MDELKHLFSQQGKLSKILTDYSAREGQTEMALDINSAIQEKTSLIIAVSYTHLTLPTKA